MADGTGVFRTFSFILRGSFSHWPTFNCVSFTENFCLQSHCQGHYLIFFHSWVFVSTEFSFKLLYYNQRKFLVPLRLGSRFLQVLLIFSELKLQPRLRLSPVFLLPLHTGSVSLSWFQRCSALPLQLLLHWSKSPLLSWFQRSAIMYFLDLHCAYGLVMSSSEK